MRICVWIYTICASARVRLALYTYPIPVAYTNLMMGAGGGDVLDEPTGVSRVNGKLAITRSLGDVRFRCVRVVYMVARTAT